MNSALPAAAPAGLIEAPDIDTPLLGLWRPAHGGEPPGPPLATTTGPLATVPA